MKKLILLGLLFMTITLNVKSEETNTEATNTTAGSTKYFFVIPQGASGGCISSLPSSDTCRTISRAIAKADTYHESNPNDTVRILVMPGKYIENTRIDDNAVVDDVTTEGTAASHIIPKEGIVVNQLVEIYGSWIYNSMSTFDSNNWFCEGPGADIPEDKLSIFSTNGKGRGFYVDGGQLHNFIVEGCHSSALPGGGGVYIDNGGLVMNCVIRKNTSTYKDPNENKYNTKSMYILQADGQIVEIITQRGNLGQIDKFIDKNGNDLILADVFPTGDPNKEPLGICFESIQRKDGTIDMRFMSIYSVKSPIDNQLTAGEYNSVGTFTNTGLAKSDTAGLENTNKWIEIGKNRSPQKTVMIIDAINKPNYLKRNTTGGDTIVWYVPALGEVYSIFSSQARDLDFTLKELKKTYTNVMTINFGAFHWSSTMLINKGEIKYFRHMPSRLTSYSTSQGAHEWIIPITKRNFDPTK